MHCLPTVLPSSSLTADSGHLLGMPLNRCLPREHELIKLACIACGLIWCGWAVSIGAFLDWQQIRDWGGCVPTPPHALIWSPSLSVPSATSRRGLPSCPGADTFILSTECYYRKAFPIGLVFESGKANRLSLSEPRREEVVLGKLKCQAARPFTTDRILPVSDKRARNLALQPT